MSSLVLLSGGQDSTICLYWALKHRSPVTCLVFDYNQRHNVEIHSALKIAQMAGVGIKVLQTNLFQDIGGSALLNKNEDISAKHKNTELPSSFVPGRNIFLLTVAGMVAYKKGIEDIVTGVCQTDYSGYPDCKHTTIQALEYTLELGMDHTFVIHTPLMWMTKAESIILAKSLHGCMEALAYSHTCYEGEIPPCGKCPSCLLRMAGFKEAGVPDPLIERLKKEGKI